MKLAEYRALAKKTRRKGRNKFGAVPTVVDDIRFASKAEARRYVELRRMQACGVISNLETHPRFPIHVEGVHVCDYVGDFRYFRDGKRIVEDVKGRPTKTPLYRLKKKLVAAVYHVEIVEVGG